MRINEHKRHTSFKLSTASSVGVEFEVDGGQGLVSSTSDDGCQEWVWKCCSDTFRGDVLHGDEQRERAKALEGK